MRLRHWRPGICAIVGMVIMTGVGHTEEATRLQGMQENVVVAVNQDQIAGKWKQFVGELKKKWAEFTDDDLMLIEGRIDKLEGKIQERYGDRREEVKRWVDEWFESHGENVNPS